MTRLTETHVIDTRQPPGGGFSSSGSVWKRLWAATRTYRPALIALIALIVVGGFTNSAFLSSRNILAMLSAQSVLWMVALGITFVLLSGGLDLSVGALAAVSGIAAAELLKLSVPGWLVIIIVILLGGLIGGVINGVPVARWRLPVFVVTLATMTALTGFAQLWSGSSAAFITDKAILILGSGQLWGLPIPVWLMVVTFAVAYYVQRFTYFGRDIYAVGGNATAAALAGIRVERTQIAVYTLAGVMAALGGLIATGRIGAATPQVDGTLPLAAIAAALLGGTTLVGGAGGVGGTVLGVLFIGGLANYLSISGVPQAWQQVLTGVILLLAVRGDRIRRRRKRAAVRDAEKTPPSPPQEAAATG